MYPPLLFVLLLGAWATFKLLKPAAIANKYLYKYAAFVLVFTGVSYAVKITVLLVK